MKKVKEIIQLLNNLSNDIIKNNNFVFFFLKKSSKIFEVYFFKEVNWNI